MTNGLDIDRLPLDAGELGLCRLPGLDGDIKGDLAHIAEFDPALVISLTTADEMAARGAADLPECLAEVGINWRHFPIADFGTPPPDAAPLWRAVAAEARAALEAGGRVLIHCKAGRGRSGTVALRLMIEAGEDPDTALARLRAARPGTVETEAQQGWAKADAPAGSSAPSRP